MVECYDLDEGGKQLGERMEEKWNESRRGTHTICSFKELLMNCRSTKQSFIRTNDLLDLYIKLESNNVLFPNSCQAQRISSKIVIDELRSEKFKKFELLTNFISVLVEYSPNDNLHRLHRNRNVITEILLDKTKNVSMQTVKSFQEIIEDKILNLGSFNVKFDLEEIRQLYLAKSAETGRRTSRQLVVQLFEHNAPEFYPSMKLAALLLNLAGDDFRNNGMGQNNNDLNIQEILGKYLEDDEISRDNWRCQLTSLCSILHIDDFSFFQRNTLISQKMREVFLFYANLLETMWEDKPSGLVLRLMIGDVNRNYDGQMNVIRFDGVTTGLQDENAIYRYRENVDVGLLIFEKLLIDNYYLAFRRKLFHDNLICLNFDIVKRCLALNYSHMDKIVELVIILMKNILIYQHEYRKEKWHVLMKDVPWMIQEVERGIGNDKKLQERLSKEKQLLEEFSNWYNRLPIQPRLNIPPLFTCYHVTEQGQLSFLFDDVIREKEIQKRSQIGDVIICNENENEEILKANDLDDLNENMLYDNTVRAFLSKCREYLCECAVCDPEGTRKRNISKIRERIINRTDEMKIKDTLSSEKHPLNDTLLSDDEKRRDSTGSIGSFMNKENDNKNSSFNTSAILSANTDNVKKLEKLNEDMKKLSMKIHQQIATNNDILIYKQLATAKEIVEKMMEMEHLEKELNRSSQQERAVPSKLFNNPGQPPMSAVPSSTNNLNIPTISNRQPPLVNIEYKESTAPQLKSYEVPKQFQPSQFQQMPPSHMQEEKVNVPTGENLLMQMSEVEKPKKKEKSKNSFFDDDDGIDNLQLPKSKNFDLSLNPNDYTNQQSEQVTFAAHVTSQDHAISQPPSIPQATYPQNYEHVQQPIQQSGQSFPNFNGRDGNNQVGNNIATAIQNPPFTNNFTPSIIDPSPVHSSVPSSSLHDSPHFSPKYAFHQMDDGNAPRNDLIDNFKENNFQPISSQCQSTFTLPTAEQQHQQHERQYVMDQQQNEEKMLFEQQRRSSVLEQSFQPPPIQSEQQISMTEQSQLHLTINDESYLNQFQQQPPSSGARLTTPQNAHFDQQRIPFSTFQPPMSIPEISRDHNQIPNSNPFQSSTTRRSSGMSIVSHKSENQYVRNQNDLFQQHYGQTENLSLEQQTKLLLPPGLDMTDAFNPDCFVPPPPEENLTASAAEEEIKENTNITRKESSNDVKKRNAFYEESEAEKNMFKKQMDQDKPKTSWIKWATLKVTKAIPFQKSTEMKLPSDSGPKKVHTIERGYVTEEEAKSHNLTMNGTPEYEEAIQRRLETNASFNAQLVSSANSTPTATVKDERANYSDVNGQVPNRLSCGV